MLTNSKLATRKHIRANSRRMRLETLRETLAQREHAILDSIVDTLNGPRRTNLMTHSNPGTSTLRVRRFVLIAVVIAALAAGAIFFAPGMLADTSRSPAAGFRDSGASAPMQALAAEQLRNAAPAAVAAASFRDSGASAPMQALAAEQLRNAAPAESAVASYRDAGASAPLLAAPAVGYLHADTSPAALVEAPASGYRYADPASPSDNMRLASYTYAGTAPAASVAAARGGNQE
jgi:hypothetical protein